MIECPVCGAAVIGQPSHCGDCGTPLDRVRETNDSYEQVLPLLLPGLSHLWRGYLLRGTIGLFGSFSALFWLLAKLQRMEWSFGTLVALLLWAVVWTTWSLGWHWNRIGVTAQPSPGRIVSTVLVLLALSNVVMFVLVIGIFTGTKI